MIDFENVIKDSITDIGNLENFGVREEITDYIAFDLRNDVAYLSENDLPDDIYKYLKSDMYKKHLEVLKRDGSLLELVTVQTPEIVLNAVSNFGTAVEFAIVQTLDVCKAAIKNNPESIRYMCTANEQIILKLLREDISLLDYLEDSGKKF